MSKTHGLDPLIDPVERTAQVGERIILVRQERAVWDAFDEMCRREGLTLEILCNRLEPAHGADALADGLERYVTRYFKDAAAQASSPQRGMSENGGEPKPSAALIEALEAVGSEPDQH